MPRGASSGAPRRARDSVRGVGTQRQLRIGNRRLQRLGSWTGSHALSRGFRSLGNVRAAGGRGQLIQVLHTLRTARVQRGQGRSLCLRVRIRTGHGLQGLPRGRLCMGRRGMDGGAGKQEPARCSARGLRSPSRIVDALRGGGRTLADVRRVSASAGRLRCCPGVHSCRAVADHRAPVRGVMGLPIDRVFRSDESFRRASRIHGVRRHTPPQGYRSDPRLGARALSRRPPQLGPIRRHGTLRAPRFDPRATPALEYLDLQLRTHGSREFPALERSVLVRQVPRRRDSGGRRGVNAIPRLRPRRGRMVAQPIRRQGEHRGNRLPAEAQRADLRPVPGRAHGR